MQSLHSGSSACLKSKAHTLDARFWVFCLPKIQCPNLGCKVAFWVFCLPKIQGPHLWMQGSGSSACLKFKAQTLDAKFAFWVCCLPKIQSPNLGCKVCHSGSSACPKCKAQTLDAQFAFWVFCVLKIQGPNLGFKLCILSLLRAQNARPKPWMQSLHSGSAACLKSKAQTLDAKFAFWVFCLPKIQSSNLGCEVCILGLLRAKNSELKPWMQSLHSGSSACQKSKAQTLDAQFAFWVFCLPKNSRPKPWMQSLPFWVFFVLEIQGPNLGCKVCILGLLPA